MKLMRNVRIGVRLGLGFSAVLLCALAIVAVGCWQMAALQQKVALIVDKQVDSMAGALEMREISGAVSLTLRRISAPTDAAEGLRELQKMKQLLANYANAERAVRRDSDDSASHSLLVAVAREQQAILPLIKKVEDDVAAANYFDAASTVGMHFLPLHEKWSAALAALATLQRQKVADTYAALQVQQRRAQYGMIAAGAVTIVLGTFFAWFITRTITLPLAVACRAADTIAARDLRQTIPTAGRDETGRLSLALQAMQRNLVDTTASIRNGAEVLAVAAREIAQGNDDLSSRTEAQASALEKTVVSMADLTDTVRRNADRATRAHGLMTDASSTARQGGDVVLRVLETMDAIRASSSKIADIIGVIDGIAFQTNILALNAAVEAARAGENGRGFAVVAGEVRNLAQRSAGAAREIKRLIGDSVDNVSRGVQLADAAVQSMRGTVDSVGHVAGLIEEIASASEQQHAGIADVTRAISELDAMTQQNAALVEQSAAAAASLTQQTAALVNAVRVFKTASTPVVDRRLLAR